MVCFLLGRATAIPTGTVLLLRDPDELSVPIDPLYRGVCNLPRSETKPSRHEANQPCLESFRFRELFTGVQQTLEFSIGENILVGVPGSEVSAVSVGPVMGIESIGAHRTLECDG